MISVKPIITKMSELFVGQWTSWVMRSLLDVTPNGKLSMSVVEFARPLTFSGFQALAFLIWPNLILYKFYKIRRYKLQTFFIQRS